MELREGLELISKVCRAAEDCDACPFNRNTKGAVYCTLDNIGDGKNIDIICKEAEEVKEQEKKPMTVEDAQVYVMNHLDDRTKLEQLAEDAAELSRAALQLLRAKGLSDNPALITPDRALTKMHEKIIDVLMCARTYNCELECADFADAAENSAKWLRWAERLKGTKR